jgi:hypothetical protein
MRILHDSDDLLVIYSPDTLRRVISTIIMVIGIVLLVAAPIAIIVGLIQGGGMNEAVRGGLSAGVMGVLFGSVGGLVLYFTTDTDFQFRRHEMDLRVREGGKDVSIPLDRVVNAVIEEESDGDGGTGAFLRVKLRDPDEQLTLNHRTDLSERSLLRFADAINSFLRRLREREAEKGSGVNS